jgi:SagB-type dehydrogenase family enzyme
MTRLSIRSGTTLDEENGLLTLSAPSTRVTLENPSDGAREAIQLLFQKSLSEDEIIERAARRDGSDAAPTLAHLLRRIDASGLICRTIGDGPIPLARAIPLAESACWSEASFVSDSTYHLCRFATFRADEGQIILESARTAFRFTLLHPEASSCILAFAVARRGDTAPHYELLLPLLDSLVASGFLISGAEEETAAATWNPVDLLFHARNRRIREEHAGDGRDDAPLQGQELPAVRPPIYGDVLALPLADLEKLASEDPPLVTVMESRRSIRQQGEFPITSMQLGELLWRTARIRNLHTVGGNESTSRPYPAAGARYELEIYPLIDRCLGVPSGLYHYCPQRHALTRLARRTVEVARILEHARTSLRCESHPQVVLIFAARFGRMSTAMQSGTYAAILKDVGVLYQSLYLAATAMGLAACALQSGDSELFARATGLDWLEEGSVGELAIGTRG